MADEVKRVHRWLSQRNVNLPIKTSSCLLDGLAGWGFGEAGCPLGVSPRSSFFWLTTATPRGYPAGVVSQKKSFLESRVPSGCPSKPPRNGRPRNSCKLYVRQADRANLDTCSWIKHDPKIAAILAVAEPRIVEQEADGMLRAVASKHNGRERLERVFPAVVLDLQTALGVGDIGHA